MRPTFLDNLWPDLSRKIAPISNEFTDSEKSSFLLPFTKYFWQPYWNQISPAPVLLSSLERLDESIDHSGTVLLYEIGYKPSLQAICPSVVSINYCLYVCTSQVLLIRLCLPSPSLQAIFSLQLRCRGKNKTNNHHASSSFFFRWTVCR